MSMSRAVALLSPWNTAFLAVAALVIVGCPADEKGAFHQLPGPDALTNLCPTGTGAPIEPCSDEGATRCDATGSLAVCTELSGCLQWGTPSACPPGTACEAGACVARGCEDAPCTALDQRRCDPSDVAAYQLCGDTDQDGCLAWLAKTDCPAGQVCAQSGSCGATCADECADGFTRCEGDAVVTCADHDLDGCLEWGGATACAAHCSVGVCVAMCEDECAAAGLTRCDGTGFAECRRRAEADGGCLAWGPIVGCPVGTSCSNGVCGAGCGDECADGETACEAGGSRRCGQFDGDACRDWSLPVACASGATCSRGACATECVSECTRQGARTCDGQAILGCGQYDGDGCLEWSTIGRCDEALGEICANGACAVSCVDACDAGAVRCRPGATALTEACIVLASGCRGWELAEDCAAAGPGRAVCAEGHCAATCTDDCTTAGQDACLGESAVTTCGQFDDDACLDWGTEAPCDPAMACVDGVCAPIPAPTGMKISEILPNAEGPDYDVFIELAGPPGASLAGLTLEAINGKDGASYGQLTLGGTFDAGGYFVIAHPAARSEIADVADVLSTFADLQNGPDNLRLRWGDTTLDALGYGGFDAFDHFEGEGSPAAEPGAGESLGRLGALQDTDDNAVDFAVSATPNPGGGFVPVITPREAGQVIFAEIMANPAAISDSLGEWFELVSTASGESFDLRGCEIRSKTDEVHVINNPILVEPGGIVVLGRQPHAGFAASYYYGNAIGLTNENDQLSLVCSGVVIDTVAWSAALPDGASWNLDPLHANANDNDSAANRCRSPVTPRGDVDEGTPGATNPPCPGSGDGYNQTLFASAAGSCGDAADWHQLTFVGAPVASSPGTLTLDWQGVFCAVLPGSTTLELQFEVMAGGSGATTWQSIGTDTIASANDACTWLQSSAFIDTTVLTSALAVRADSASIVGRYRIASNCPGGTGCGLLGIGPAANCVRNVTLSYPYE